MSVSASMAAVSAANASIAAQAAHRAKVSECKVIEHEFDSKIATVAQKNEYADCINVLYPQAMSSDMTIFLKVLFVTFLLSAIFGFIHEKNNNYGGFLDCILSAVMWGIAVPFLIVCTLGILVGVYWLFN